MTFIVSEIKDSIGNNIRRQSYHQSKNYPPLSPQEMEVFILFVQERPFLPANITYRDWFEMEKDKKKKANTLLGYVEGSE